MEELWATIMPLLLGAEGAGAGSDAGAGAPQWIKAVYLAAAVLFVLGIKGLTHPRTAVRGNLTSAVGMLLAVIATAFLIELNWAVVLLALGLGAVLGAVAAIRVPMTGMPQMVAIFNGFGGGASVCVAWAELMGKSGPALQEIGIQAGIATGAAGLIGTVTFWGSLLAFAKLQEIKGFKSPIALPGQQVISALLLVGAVAIGAWIVMEPGASPLAYLLLVVVASALGFTLVSPIGGADMPVVVALLNSYSGLAAAATGFVIANTVLIIAGSLVGASGLILTAIMCKAMNRSLQNVLFGKIEAGGSADADDIYEGKIKSTSAEEVSMLMDSARRVVIVPGYGMAVAQAQHAVRDLYQMLDDRGVNVEFAIHPVAGRMPGHMNVLLAEVDIPYDKLVEMDRINPELEQVDVAIVLGANDVVNPDARKADSPIAGMPILEVDKARTVVVIKRSLSPGFAGIPNPLFAADNTLMLFGDGKQAVMDLTGALQEA